MYQKEAVSTGGSVPLKLCFCAILWLAVIFSQGEQAGAADGVPLWTNYVFGTSSLITPAGIGLDGSGNVVVTGILNTSALAWGTVKYSAAGLPLWTNLFFPAGSTESMAKALALDMEGNVYVTGVTYPPGGLPSDCATIKYSSAGVPLWTNLCANSGPGGAYGAALVVDTSSNVFVTGGASVGATTSDFLTIKYSSAGLPLWTNFYNGTGNDNDLGNCIALDRQGSVIVTGSSTSNGSHFLVSLKYTTDGLPVWTNIFNGLESSADVPISMVVDATNDIFIAGYALDGSSSFDYLTVGYAGSGVPLWTNFYNGAGNGSDNARGTAVDSSGSVYVTGYAIGKGSSDDYVTIKYSNAGAPLWTNIYNGPGNGTDQALALALDGNANVYVTGAAILKNNTDAFATIKYSSDGLPIWTNLFSSTATNSSGAKAMAVDQAGDVYVTGSSEVGSLPCYATIKYSGPPPPFLSFTTTNGSFGFANRYFSLRLTGPAGSNAVISASTNLQSWVPLVTNQLTGGTIMFTDALATNYLRRFYRAALQ